MTDRDIIFAVIFTTLVLLLLVAAIAITFFVTIRQRMEQKMKMKQVALEYEQELRAAETVVSESVRAHLSREIHDNIGHMVTYLRLQMENKILDDEALGRELQPMLETTVDISQQLRLFSRALNPDYIKDQSLAFLLRQEAERIRQLKKMEVHLIDDAEHPELTKDQQLITFRIYQEILHNTLKHSKAQRLHIELMGSERFSLLVRDDGKGFDLPAALSSSNGLKNMMRRAELAGMYCTIDTAPGKGCSTFITLKENSITRMAIHRNQTSEYAPN